MPAQTLTSKQAVELLGIKEATLYAYVSRGMIRSIEPEAGENTRARQYLAEDVYALLRRKSERRDPAKAAEDALNWGAPVLESALTRIEGGRLFYRGQDAAGLALSAPFEQVAALMWGADEKTREKISETVFAQAEPEHDRLSMLAARALNHLTGRTLGQSGHDPAENLWDVLRGGRLGGLDFRQQYTMEDGQTVAEYVCEAARLIVRIDARTPQDRVYPVDFGMLPSRMLVLHPNSLGADMRRALVTILELALETTALSAEQPVQIGADAAPTLAALQSIIALAANDDLRAYDTSALGCAAAGSRILRLLTGAITSEAAAGSIPQALSLVYDAPSPIFNAALILCADHELNASSFTARVVAGTGAHPYAAVSAALAALSGPKHGGSILSVYALIEEAALHDVPEAAVSARVRRGEGIAGFGHRLYPGGDPRYIALMTVIESYYADQPRLKFCRALAAAGAAATGHLPNIDFALASLVYLLGRPAELGMCLFALGRTVGWIAHAIEQYADGRLIRPRAKYTGE